VNISLLSDFLGVVESALRNPQDKTAVKIAIDGIAAWRAIAGLPQIQQLEADVGAYIALLPKPSQPAGNSGDPGPSEQQPEAGARGGSMYQGEGAVR
jgi:hypothetical protein